MAGETMREDELVRRLNLIESLILAEEFDFLSEQVEKISPTDDRTHAIGQAIRERAYSNAMDLITKLRKDLSSIERYEDPEIRALRLELSSLEDEYAETVTKRAELERQIREFDFRYYQEVGDQVAELLELRERLLERKKSKDPTMEPEYDEARRDRDTFGTSRELSEERPVTELTDAEQEELKQMFRAGSKLCHPDVVKAEIRDWAQENFAALADAYDRGDLEGVKSILQDIRQGKESDHTAAIDDLGLIRDKCRALRQQIESEIAVIQEIKLSKAYITMNSHPDLDGYFGDLRIELEEEILALRTEIGDEQ